MSMNDKFRIYPLADLRQKDGPQSFKVAKYLDGRLAYHQNGAMFMDEEGKVFYNGRRTDIREEKAEARRAFCRLTGIKNKDMDAAVKAFKEAEDAKYRDENVADIKREAAKLGYELVKTELAP